MAVSSTTIRRVGAVLAVLLAANVHVLVRSTDPYRIGTGHHAIFAWTSLAAFWLALAYLAGSVGRTLLVGVPTPDDGGHPTDD
ncbi:MAG: hypothetical protein ABEJ57_02215 [Halobacteriaceae archaeon]